MKKLTIFLMSLMLFACSDDKDVLQENTSRTSLKTTSTSAIENFRIAINEMNHPKYFPTKEYMEKNGSELSPERKEILLQPAIDLIFSTGISKNDFEKEMKGNTEIILNNAFEIYITNTNKK